MTKTISIRCPVCGHPAEREACPECDGKGHVFIERLRYTENSPTPTALSISRVACPACGGTGIKDGLIGKVQRNEESHG